ncbi:hypothetical protein PM082_012287 [Marasmius tenuissimus]|nr:hypothetical protein PM082_012287 [Marasmius tenuissimus]
MVCGRWRETVLGTPSLWSNISLYLSSAYTVDECVALGSITRLFLHRSQSAPLRLTLRLPSNYKATNAVTEKNLELLSTFTEHVERCRFLSIKSPLSSSLHHPTFRAFTSRLFNVKHLSLVVRSYDTLANESPKKVDFCKCRSLTSLQLDYFSDASILALSWEHITELNFLNNKYLRYINIPSSIASVLVSCPNLRSLEISLDSLKSSSDLPFITLHRLEHLALHHIDRYPIVFPVLSLPRLSTLDLHEPHPLGGWLDIPLYTDFLSRTCQTITHLLWRIPGRETSDNLLSLLPVLPNLQELRIAQWDLNLDTSFYDFAFQSDPSPILPRLDNLNFVLIGQNLDVPQLVEAVRSKNLPSRDLTTDPGVRAYIRSLVIYMCPEEGRKDIRKLDDNETEALYSLKDVGLAVQLYYTGSDPWKALHSFS